MQSRRRAVFFTHCQAAPDCLISESELTVADSFSSPRPHFGVRTHAFWSRRVLISESQSKLTSPNQLVNDCHTKCDRPPVDTHEHASQVTDCRARSQVFTLDTKSQCLCKVSALQGRHTHSPSSKEALRMQALFCSVALLSARQYRMTTHSIRSIRQVTYVVHAARDMPVASNPIAYLRDI